MIPLDAVLAHVGGFGLVDEDRTPYDGRGEPDLVDRVRRAKVTGLASAAVAAGDLLVDDGQADALAEAQASLAAMILEIDALTLRAVDDLGRHGLVLLKGMAHAHLDYPDPSLREYGDVDLFVSAARFEEVEAWFATRGFERSFSEFAPTWSAEFGKSVTLASVFLEVDLHRNLSQGLALGVRPDHVRSRRSSFELGGVTVPTLDAPARLVHAAIHALGGSSEPPLTGLIDVVRMSQDVGRVRRAVSLAREWDVAATLGDAIRSAHRSIGGVPDESRRLVATERGTASERLRRRILDGSRHEFRSDTLAGFVSVRGVAPRVRFVRSLVSGHTSRSTSR